MWASFIEASRSRLAKLKKGRLTKGSGRLAVGQQQQQSRLWLASLLCLLAVAGLLANLLLLYASIDQFVALLRQRCSAGGAQSLSSLEQQQTNGGGRSKFTGTRAADSSARDEGEGEEEVIGSEEQLKTIQRVRILPWRPHNHNQPIDSSTPSSPSTSSPSPPLSMDSGANGIFDSRSHPQQQQSPYPSAISPPSRPVELAHDHGRNTLTLTTLPAAKIIEETLTTTAMTPKEAATEGKVASSQQFSADSRPTTPKATTTITVTLPIPKHTKSSGARMRVTAADLREATAKVNGNNNIKNMTMRTIVTVRPREPGANEQEEQRQQTTGGGSLTLVTALFDIGRDRWMQYGRTMQQYHQYMRNLLQLQVPMVVFVDHKSAEFVHRERSRIGWGHRTRVHRTSLAQLPLFTHIHQVRRIMRAELTTSWRPDWDPSMVSHPEASHPEYVLLVNSKPFFMAEVATENPFETDFFVWLDAGYGHGQRAVFPSTWRWQPTFPRDKISCIKLTPPSDPISRYSLEHLYRQDVAVLSGGFLAGGGDAVKAFYRFHYHKFLSLLERRKVDDDQTLLVLLANDQPQLFDISHGDWFDAFELY